MRSEVLLNWKGVAIGPKLTARGVGQPCGCHIGHMSGRQCAALKGAGFTKRTQVGTSNDGKAAEAGSGLCRPAP